jgi:Tfp pilus assembly protein PilF
MKFLGKLPIFLLIIPWIIIQCQTIEEKNVKKDELLNTQLNIVLSHLNNADPHKAYKEARALLEDHPKHPELINMMGLIFLSMKKPQEAEKYFRQAYTLKNSAAFVLNLSSALIEQKQYKKAIQLLRGYSKKDSSYQFPERFHHNIALAFEKSGQIKLARRAYHEALKINPMNYMTLIQIAKLYPIGTKPRSNHLDQAIKSCPRCLEPVKLQSESLIKAGKKQEALAVLKRFQSEDGVLETDRKEVQTKISRLE